MGDYCTTGRGEPQALVLSLHVNVRCMSCDLWGKVVVRVMRRDGLGEEEVRKRMGAQPTVQEYVSHANVVICTQWDYSVTQKQVWLSVLVLMFI